MATLLVVLAVGSASAVGVRIVNGHQNSLQERRLILETANAQANLISATEWQAIAAGTVSPELREQQESQSAQLRALLGTVGDQPVVATDAEMYLTAVDEEFSLIQRGKVSRNMVARSGADSTDAGGRAASAALPSPSGSTVGGVQNESRGRECPRATWMRRVDTHVRRLCQEPQR